MTVVDGELSHVVQRKSLRCPGTQVDYFNHAQNM